MLHKSPCFSKSSSNSFLYTSNSAFGYWSPKWSQSFQQIPKIIHFFTFLTCLIDSFYPFLNLCNTHPISWVVGSWSLSASHKLLSSSLHSRTLHPQMTCGSPAPLNTAQSLQPSRTTRTRTLNRTRHQYPAQEPSSSQLLQDLHKNPTTAQLSCSGLLRGRGGRGCRLLPCSHNLPSQSKAMVPSGNVCIFLCPESLHLPTTFYP